MHLRIAGIWILLLAACSHADSYIRQPAVDVMRYEISIDLTGVSDSISATTKIYVRMRTDGVAGMCVDFAGMQIDDLLVQGVRRSYQQHNESISFGFGREYSRDEIVIVEVRYHGKPNEGLFIGQNKYGRRVFFTENWPDRAHHWFPSIDHPSDKATVQVSVIAPREYSVISNGRMVRTRILGNGQKLTQWDENRAIPTYCVALGVGEYSIAHQKNSGGVPVDWYFYPQDSEAAARKFRPTAEALDYFSSLIGPYPYEKLAQVEATVSFGGMENSSAVFYSESSFREAPVSEDPVPHEIAHQWFGDSVTQTDWDHLWLSEGFATYFEALFNEHQHGAGVLKQTMAGYAKKLAADEMARTAPMVDPGQTDLMKKLNSLNYEKGAWVLHMLRGVLGDACFFKGIRRYYSQYQNGNVTSDDFRRTLESASDTSLKSFFHQWLYQPGWPEYHIAWQWNEAAGEVEVSIRQKQTTGLFDMPLEIVFKEGDRREARKLCVFKAVHLFRIPLKEKPQSIEIDPDGWVLKTLSVEQP